MPQPPSGRGSAAVHAGPAAWFALLSVAFTWPLLPNLNVAVLGAGAGDNMSALWNIWWARTAIFGPSSFFWTDSLFAPSGTGLVLHSFAPLESAVAGVLTVFDPVVAYNLALIAAVFLNFACAYWASWSITRDALASCFAAVAFGGAPFLLLRLHGHMNVLNAWGLPLLLIAIRRYQRTATLSSAVLLAVALAVLVYTDAYFAIFGLLVTIGYLALTRWPIRVSGRPLTAGRIRALEIIVPLMVVVAVVIAWIAWSGGTHTQILGVELNLTDNFNGKVLLGFLIGAACLTWKWPAIRLEPTVNGLSNRIWTLLPAAAVMAAGLAVPLMIAAFRLWRAGDYESQVYFWRNAPPGIDLAALALGNPHGLLAGRWSGPAYERLGIDRSESAVWLGLASIALIVSSVRRLRTSIEARAFMWIAGLFFVWSLGPYLRLFGYNTAFMLPQTFMRFVPVVANARIPGRAFVVVLLMVALLGAMALSTIAESRRRTLASLVALAALLVDFWPASHRLTPADRRPLYLTLLKQPAGIVLEIPLGVRDGFGQRGFLDHRVLLYQTVHQHPQMGGFVARLSGRIKRAYDADPILGPILDLSEGRPPSPPALPAAPAPQECRLTCEVRYVVIDEDQASSELQAFAARAFPLRLLERNGARVLYAVDQQRR